jgi:hypothetical protein
MSNTKPPTHLFVVTPLDVKVLNRMPVRHMGPVFSFRATPEDAEGIFFEKGYILNSETGLFSSKTPESPLGYIVETFETTDGSNSTDDDVPNRLSLLLEGNYGEYPTTSLRFGKLQVLRSVLRQGGKRRHRKVTRKRSYRKRGSRK